jgi:hypothetical protein
MAHYTPLALTSMHINNTFKILQDKETHAIDLQWSGSKKIWLPLSKIHLYLQIASYSICKSS